MPGKLMIEELILKKFPIGSFEQKNISSISQDFLITTGLPEWVAPHLYFGEFNDFYLPILSEWAWQEDWKESFQLAVEKNSDVYVIGCAQDSEPIVLKQNDPAVYIFSPCGTQLNLLNSSLKLLLETIYHYSEMVNNAISENENAFIKNAIPTALFKRFIETLNRIEPRLNASNSVWLLWASAKTENA